VNTDEIRELASVYALGGLDGDDRVRFEALLAAGDPEATAALREFEETLLAVAVPAPEPPPARVKQALLERIHAEERREPVRIPLRPAPPAPAAARRSWWPVAWAAAMAAGIGAIAVGLWISSSYENRLEALAQETRELRAELERQQSVLALVRDPTAQIVSLAGLEPAPGARARVIWNPPSGGLLVATGLPSPPAGKTYQLWAIVGNKPPVPAGLLEVDARGAGSLRVPPLRGVEAVDVFAVTLEPGGGVPAPTGPMYLAGKSA
jgi:anti-sigma-K factor RskA